MDSIDPNQGLDIPLIIGEKRVRNRIYRVGIELEGGWSSPPALPVARDGSLDRWSHPPEVKVKGEIKSPPIPPSAVPDFINAHYPPFVHETCGLHVHMSFDSALCYSRLMRPDYPATIVKAVARWAERTGLPMEHPIWNRLSGKSVYCQMIYDAPGQVRNRARDYDQHRPGHRYTVINYCFGTHGTVECRLLPMMHTKEQAIEAIQTIITTTNAFLVATAKKEKKVVSEIEPSMSKTIDIQESGSGVTITENSDVQTDIRYTVVVR